MLCDRIDVVVDAESSDSGCCCSNGNGVVVVADVLALRMRSATETLQSQTAAGVDAPLVGRKVGGM